MYTIHATFPDGLKATCTTDDAKTVNRIIAELEDGTAYVVVFNGRPLWI